MAEQTEMISAWVRHFEGVKEDVGAFYSRVEHAIKMKQLPKITFERTKGKEAGMFSASREYLRIYNDDFRYIVCAAPFANGFYVSARLFAIGKLADDLLAGARRGEGGVLGLAAKIVIPVLVGSETYFAVDTAEICSQLMHAGLMEEVDNIGRMNNKPLLSEADRRPVMKSFFQ